MWRKDARDTRAMRLMTGDDALFRKPELGYSYPRSFESEIRYWKLVVDCKHLIPCDLHGWNPTSPELDLVKKPGLKKPAIFRNPRPSGSIRGSSSQAARPAWEQEIRTTDGHRSTRIMILNPRFQTQSTTSTSAFGFIYFQGNHYFFKL